MKEKSKFISEKKTKMCRYYLPHEHYEYCKSCKHCNVTNVDWDGDRGIKCSHPAHWSKTITSDE